MLIRMAIMNQAPRASIDTRRGCAEIPTTRGGRADMGGAVRLRPVRGRG